MTILLELTSGPPRPYKSISKIPCKDSISFDPSLSPECSAAMMPTFIFFFDTYRSKPLLDLSTEEIKVVSAGLLSWFSECNFLIASSSPSKSVTIMSGTIPFSKSGFNELSAAILIDFLNFFNFGIANDKDGPEPITKTVFPWINFVIFDYCYFFLK